MFFFKKWLKILLNAPWKKIARSLKKNCTLAFLVPTKSTCVPQFLLSMLSMTLREVRGKDLIGCNNIPQGHPLLQSFFPVPYSRDKNCTTSWHLIPATFNVQYTGPLLIPMQEFKGTKDYFEALTYGPLDSYPSLSKISYLTQIQIQIQRLFFRKEISTLPQRIFN